METRRLWLAVLLTLLQYAAVTGAPIEDCIAAPAPSSKCPDGTETTHGCVPKTSTPDKLCDGGLGTFIYDKDIGGWVKVGRPECIDGATKHVKVHGPGKDYDLATTHNVVCAKQDPGACPALTPLSKCPDGVDAAVGCTKKTSVLGDVDACGTELEMFWSRGDTKMWSKLARIACNKTDNKWRAHEPSVHYELTAADNVVCAKKEPFECKPNQPPSKCPPNVPSFVGCRQIKMDKKMTCGNELDLKLFVLDAASGTWKQGFESVECGSSKWTAKAIADGVVDMTVTTANTVVCAKRDPAESETTTTEPASTATDPAVSTIAPAESTPNIEGGPLPIFLASIIVFAFV